MVMCLQVEIYPVTSSAFYSKVLVLEILRYGFPSRIKWEVDDGKSWLLQQAPSLSESGWLPALPPDLRYSYPTSKIFSSEIFWYWDKMESHLPERGWLTVLPSQQIFSCWAEIFWSKIFWYCYPSPSLIPFHLLAPCFIFTKKKVVHLK